MKKKEAKKKERQTASIVGRERRLKSISVLLRKPADLLHPNANFQVVSCCALVEIQ